MVVLKIAFRNLWEHKTKTLIIGFLIALAIILLVVGNSIMDTATQGLESTYKASYTGDLIIHPPSDPGVSLFGAAGPSAVNSVLPTIDDWEKIADFLDQRSVPWSAQTSAFGTFQVEEEIVAFGVFWGVKPEGHLELFGQSYVLEEGRFLEPGEKGIVINKTRLERIEEESEKDLGVGDTILVTGFSGNAGIKIRELEIVGIYDFEVSNEILGLISFLDPQSILEITGYGTDTITLEDLSQEEQESLGAVDEMDLFSDDMFDDFIQDVETDSSLALDFSLEVIPDESSQEFLPRWQFIITRIPPTMSYQDLEKELVEFFEENEMDLQIGDWRWGAGFTAEIAFWMQIGLNVVIFVISAVAVIIIMNTLVISITERISEIGTIRAIGGQKAFVFQLVTWETLTITGLFGLIGILIGTGILAFLGHIGITSDNEFFSVLFGGNTLRPVLSMASLFTSLIIVVLIGLISSLYPLRIALKIPPVVAMQRG